MNRTRLILTSLISIILVSILMIGSTYSIFVSTEVDENTNVYTTGILDITYTMDTNNITLSSNIPINNDEANTVVPYRLTVTNNGNVPYMFDLSLSDTTAGDVIDYQYIMTKVGELESKSLSGCTNNVIKEDIILGPGKSVDIDVRIWISDTIPNTELGNSFYATFTITGDALHHDNEEIDNSLLSLNYMKGFSDKNDTSYFHNTTYQKYIKNVAFVDYINTSNAVASWDMSEDEDESIMAWVVNNETPGYFDLYIGSNQTIYVKNLKCFFLNMRAVDSISFDNLDTSLTATMYAMFYATGYSSTVFTLDLGEKFNTSNVTNMYGMFYQTGYNSLVFNLDLGEKFDTSNVTNMGSMFWETGLSSTVFTLELGEKFDTSNVGNMYAMFYATGYSSTAFTLNLGKKFDTSNVPNMHNMFNSTGYSSTVFTLDLGEKFDTSNVTLMRAMFYRTGYSNPNFTLDLGENFSTSKVEDMKYMFQTVGYNSTVFTLDLGDKFDTSSVTNMDFMFSNVGVNNPTFTLNLGEKFNTSSVATMNHMFYYVGYNSTVFTLDLGEKFDTTAVTDMSYMFMGTGHSTSNLNLDLSTFDFTSVTSYDSIFVGFSTTQTIYVKDTTAQSWIVDKGFDNLSTSNVLVKS